MHATLSNSMWQEIPSPDWLNTQDQLDAHFLQRYAWGKFQTAYGRKVFYASGEGWSCLTILEESHMGNRLYCPYGPTVSSLDALVRALHELVAFAKAANLAYVRVEPQGQITREDILRSGLQPAHRTIQPRFTFVKDLTKTEAECLAEMSATTRNLYHTAHKKGITFYESNSPDDISIFLRLMHAVAHRNAITIHPDHYYQIMAQTLLPLNALKLYFAKIDGEPVAMNLIFNSPTTRYNAHAASSDAARKLSPGTPLLAHIIFDAKSAGKTSFDFFGIAPPDEPDHRWAGFTKFKQSFGGQVVDMHGTWELGVKKFSYAIYRLSTSLSKYR